MDSGMSLEDPEHLAKGWRERGLGDGGGCVPRPSLPLPWPSPWVPDDVDLELRLARFEQLISRRPLLLNSVLLRQNPHHVHEWHKRVALHQGRPREVRDCSVPSRVVSPTPPSPAMAPDIQADPVSPAQIINTYTEAVQTVDPFKATGKPHTLWVAFAKFYEDNGQLDDVSAFACCT